MCVCVHFSFCISFVWNLLHSHVDIHDFVRFFFNCVENTLCIMNCKLRFNLLIIACKWSKRIIQSQYKFSSDLMIIELKGTNMQRASNNRKTTTNYTDIDCIQSEFQRFLYFVIDAYYANDSIKCYELIILRIVRFAVEDFRK